MSKERFLKENLKVGEKYAGLLLGKDGMPDQHIFLLPGEAESIEWAPAKEWATSIGGELPTRREQSLLFANLKEEFASAWYWSVEPSGTGWAWYQHFSRGDQYCDHTRNALRARAVRRLVIE
ncbi:DUF1566 domain-containing protein [Herbaspirillum sp. RV1423]|uniref:DUF1566 domain-containing protein n=1 Tax=Herbaspirillum sp. RV1423 TaxID=1443993 RepID=UPI0004AF50A6|nr:DUF1566 domain-containing protein [Herbaspirillum sp. RV1423]